MNFKIRIRWAAIIVLLLLLIKVSPVNPSLSFIKNIGGDIKDEDDFFDDPVAVLYYQGYLYVSDADDSIVYKIDITENDIKKRLKTDKEDETQLIKPSGLFGLNGTVYIADEGSGVIFTYSRSPDLKVYETLLKSPVDLYIDNNTLFVLSFGKSRIYVYVDGKFNRTIGREGPYDLMFDNPCGFDIDPVNNLIYVADTDNDRVEVINMNGSMERYLGIGKGDIKLRSPSDVFYYDGYLFVTDTDNNRIVVFDTKGNPVEVYNCSDCLFPEDYEPEDETNWTFDEPKGIFVYNDTVYVADSGNQRVVLLRFSADYGASDEELEYIDEVKYEYSEIFLPYIDLADRLNITYSTDYKTIYNSAVQLEDQGSTHEAYLQYVQLDIKMDDTLGKIKMDVNKTLHAKYDNITDTVAELSSYYDTSHIEEDLLSCDIELTDGNYIKADECLNEVEKEINDVLNQIKTEELPDEEDVEELARLLDLIEERITNITSISESCGFEFEYIEMYEEKLTTAQAYYAAEDYQNARSLAIELNNETASSLSYVSRKCDDINHTLEVVRDINELLEQNKEIFSNYDEVRSELDRIEDIMYDDPAGARQAVDELMASVSAEVEAIEDKKLTVPAHIIIPIIIVITVLIIILMKLSHWKLFRRKGL